MASREMNLFKAAMHPHQLLDTMDACRWLHLVMDVTFSGLGSIPQWETIYKSNFA
jgi:hypothetical protein